MKQAFISTVIAAASILGTAAPAHADDRRCAGTIGDRSIDGNVIVPGGRTCRLNGTRVDDNVFVRDDSRLIARGVRVGGDIQAKMRTSSSRCSAARSAVSSFAPASVLTFS